MTQSDGAERLARRDQLLEVLYWIEGEGFAAAARLASLSRLLGLPEPAVADALEDLIGRGEAVIDPASGDYKLTPTGRREGARRFADEFAPLLSQGHGECNDPACECHSDPLGASECHARRHS